MNTALIPALMVHLVADWFLQSDWMARNKVHLTHPAAWIHSGIHTAGFLLVFSPLIALLLGLSHLLIDTRRPLDWLRARLGQFPEGEQGRIFETWQDQAAHILLILLVVWLTGQGS